MKVVLVTQARMSSTRLPNKVLKKINGKTLLEIHLERISRNSIGAETILATTTNPADDPILKLGKELNVRVSRGSENNVLDRFYQACKDLNPDYVIRLTSDCPLLDPKIIDMVFLSAVDKDVDYCSNTLNPTYPDGQDVEVIKFSALEKAWKEAELTSEKEHVTPYIWKNSNFKGGKLFSSFSYENDIDYGYLRMTVDEKEDFDLIVKLIETAGYNADWLEYAEIMNKNEEIRMINKDFARNEGYDKSLKEDNNE